MDFLIFPDKLCQPFFLISIKNCKKFLTNLSAGFRYIQNN